MFYHHSLRLAGRAGGVNDVGEIAGMKATIGGGQIAIGLIAPCRNRSSKVDYVADRPFPGETSRQVTLEKQRNRRAVFQHVSEAVGRIGGIKRHIGASGFHDAQQSNHHFHASLRANGDQRFGPHPQSPQVARQLVRAPIQLCIRNGAVLVDQGNRIGTLRHLFFEDLVQALVAREIGPGVVPLGQSPLPFEPAERRDLNFAGIDHEPLPHSRKRL